LAPCGANVEGQLQRALSLRATHNQADGNPARKGVDGCIDIQFGGCGSIMANCLPTTASRNDLIRLHRPNAEVLNGTREIPERDSTARPENDPSMRDPLAMLPLDLKTGDCSTREKTAYLPFALTEEGRRRFAIEAGRRCLLPWENPAMVHRRHGRPDGLIRLGRLAHASKLVLACGEHRLRIDIPS
jgi:hypothetical protein